MNQKNFSFLWNNACESGNVQAVKSLVHQARERGQIQWLHTDEDYGFRLACRHGHEELIDFFFSLEPQEKPNVFVLEGKGLKTALAHGHMEVAKKVFYEMKKCELRPWDGVIQSALNNGFIEACRNNEREGICAMMVQDEFKPYMTQWLKPPGSEHRDPWDLGLEEACYYGHIESIKELLTNPEIKKWKKWTVQDHEKMFEISLEHSHLVKWWVMEFKIKKTMMVNRYCQKNDWIEDMFKARKESEILNKLMIDQEGESLKAIKIKKL